LSTHLRLGSSKWFPSFWIPHQCPTCISLFSHACYMPCPSHPPWLDNLVL
jgi:hypothetical protein